MAVTNKQLAVIVAALGIISFIFGVAAERNKVLPPSQRSRPPIFGDFRCVVVLKCLCPVRLIHHMFVPVLTIMLSVLKQWIDRQLIAGRA